MSIAKFLSFFLILILTSCGVWTGLDPSEVLAHKIKANSQEMLAMGLNSKEFEFIPAPNKMKATSSEVSPTALLEIVYYEDEGGPVIAFNKWYSTTYQNRFVRISRSMSLAKCPGDPFVIKLTKVKNDIYLSGIR